MKNFKGNVKELVSDPQIKDTERIKDTKRYHFRERRY